MIVKKACTGVVFKAAKAGEAMFEAQSGFIVPSVEAEVLWTVFESLEDMDRKGNLYGS